MGLYQDWYSDNEDVNTDDFLYDENEDFDPFGDEAQEREEERWDFEKVPKHGVHAHAYKKSLDNVRMKRLRERGCTYRQIGKQLGCSPSTVRNRLKKMGIE